MTPSALHLARFDPAGMAVLYDSVLTADTANFDVTNIPQTYRHMLIELNARGTKSAVSCTGNVRLNNDSGANYHSISLYGTNSAAASGESYSQTTSALLTMAAATAPANYASTASLLIADYASTSLFKNVHGLNSVWWGTSAGTQAIAAAAFQWLSTAAIDRITIYPDSGSWKAGSRLTIYGLGGASIRRFGELVTSLPSSPNDGDEITLVDSITSPTYRWRLRYNSASSSSYKWEFIGGAYKLVTVATDQTFTSQNTWVNVTTDGPKFTTPYAGDWEAMGYCLTYSSVQPDAVYCGVAAGDTTPAFNNAVLVTSTGIQMGIPAAMGSLTGVAASTDLKLRYFQTSNGTVNVTARVLMVRPVRLG